MRHSVEQRFIEGQETIQSQLSAVLARRNTGGGRGTVACAGDNREGGVMCDIFEGKIGGGYREVPGENGARKRRCGISAILVHVHTRTGDDAIAARQPHEVMIV